LKKEILILLLLFYAKFNLFGQCTSENFSADITNGCLPSSIKFTASGYPSGSFFSWDFGGGFTNATPTDSVKYFLFNSVGNFTVKLKVTNGLNNCLVVKNNYISITNGPNIKLYISNPILCDFNDSVTIIDSTTGVVSRDFIIDGTLYKNASKTIKHKFSTPGAKQVSIKVLSTAGCIASLNKDSGVVAYKPPVFGFNAQSNQGCTPVQTKLIPFVYVFNGQFVTDYNWNTIGGSPSSSIITSPSITYSNIGKYDVILTVKLNTGCNYDYHRPNIVEVFPLPKIKITCSDSVLCNSNEVTLINTTGGSYPGSFSWVLPNGANYLESSTDSDTVKVSLPNVSGSYNIGSKYIFLNCYTDTLIKNIVKTKYTKANINSPNQSFCVVPSQVLFNDSGSNTDSGYIYKSIWVLRDSLGKKIDSINNNSGNYTFTKFGTYSIELYIKSTNGCNDSLVNTGYYVLGPPKVRLGFSNKKPCPNEQVNIVDITPAFSPKGIWQFRKWTIYDRDFSTIIHQDTSISTKYSFQDTGYYKVKLVVYNNLGCTDSLIDSTSIHVVGPVVDFTIDKNSLCKNETFKLEASSNTPSATTTFSWDIVNEDDSAFTYIEGNINPLSKTVGGVGRYSVRCTAYTKSCTTSVLKRKIIDVYGVLFKGVIDTLLGCKPVKFNISTQKIYNYQKSGDDTGMIFRWFSIPGGVEFSDSLKSSTSVTFVNDGCYGITLLATNAEGCQSNWLNVINTCIGNNAKFSIPKGICLGDTLKPINMSSNFAVSYFWKVSNAANDVLILPYDTSTNPLMYFKKSGNFEIILYVKTNIGCVDSFVQYINVSEPKASIYSKDTLGFCGPFLASFEYKGTPAISSIWYWEDGTSPLVSNSNFVSHLFDIKNGKNKFNISLKIVDQYGCIDSVTYKSFIKINGPVPYFTINQSKGCEPLNIEFNNQTTGAFSTIFYDDNGKIDSNNVSLYNRVYALKNIGDTMSFYIPYIIGTDSSGSCTKAYQSLDTIIVFKKPKADFSFDDSLVCINDRVNFINKSIGANKVYWDLNQDNIIDDSAFSTKFTYKQKGYYYPKIIAVNRGGCPDTLIAVSPVEVFPVVKGHIYTDQKSYCQGDSIQFYTSTDSIYPTKLQYKWKFFNGLNYIDSSYSPNPKMKFSAPGFYHVYVVINNLAGCSDTLKKDSLFYIEQKEPYIGTNINFVTIDQNKDIRINWRKCYSSGFEKYILYKTDISGRRVLLESNNNNDTEFVDTSNLNINIRASAYEVVAVEHCHTVPLYNTIHTNIVSKAAAYNTNAILVTWGAYLPWSLSMSYSIYKTRLNVFEKVYESNLNSWIDYNVCDSEYSYYIVANDLVNGFKSFSNITKASPIYVANTKPTNVKSVRVINNQDLLVRWDTSIFPKRTQKYILLESKSPYNIWTPIAETTNSELLLSSKIIEDIYRYLVIREDICGYTSDTGLYGNNIYTTSLTNNDTAFLNWNKYLETKKGVYNYSVEYFNKSEYSFTSIKNKPSTDTFFVDSVLRNLEDESFCYRIGAVTKDYSIDTSYSNTVCVSYDAQVYIPNAYTPNGDNINECFKPIISFIYREDELSQSLKYQFTIYNRWGEKIFETNNPKECWDGSYNNKPASSEIYFYRLNAVAYKSKQKYIKSGSFILLR
jgi:gliding motility-associated-like protein